MCIYETVVCSMIDVDISEWMITSVEWDETIESV